jgi:YegS/Rv2252/BmrU family lipid kinase
MTRKILFFINPISGGKSKLNLEKKIVSKCLERNIFYEILFTSKEGNYDFLHDKIEKEHITDIAICGGDGSISPIVAATLNKPVYIGLIPLGSGNGLARTAGIPNSVNKAIDLIFDGEAHSTDAFVINDKFSVHVCGLGFDAKVAYDFSKKKRRGLQTYTRIALINFRAARTYPFVIETKEAQFNVKAFLICVANSNQFGNNFKIAPKASISDGLLDVVILKKTSKSQILLSFLKQITSGKIQTISEKNIHKSNIIYFQTNQLKIENPGLAPLHIDGDPSETSRHFSIEILPSAYKLIQN